MASTAKDRNPASDAVLELRKLLGKTQQEFAVEILQTTVTTVSRYETKYPPRGEALLRLAEIAEAEAAKPECETPKRVEFYEIAQTFRTLYLEQSYDRFNDPKTSVWATSGTDRYAFQFRKLTGSREIATAMYMQVIFDVIMSKNKALGDQFLEKLKELSLRASHALAKAEGRESLIKLPDENL